MSDVTYQHARGAVVRHRVGQTSGMWQQTRCHKTIHPCPDSRYGCRGFHADTDRADVVDCRVCFVKPEYLEPTIYQRRVAGHLRRRAGHRGNHGFTGARLVAWKKQRKTMLDALDRVLGKGTPANRRAGPRLPTVTVYDRVMSARCPRTVRSGSGGGTAAGAMWVRDVDNFIWECFTDLVRQSDFVTGLA